MTVARRLTLATVSSWLVALTALTLAGCGSKSSPGQACTGAGCSAPTVASITLSPASATQPAGVAQAYTALARFSDGSTADVSSTATWSSSDEGVASIVTAGSARGIKAGAVRVIATLQGVSGQAQLVVAEPVVTQLAVSCAPARLAAGTSSSCGALATLSNGSRVNVTSLSSWISNVPSVATISGGTLRAVAAGTTTVQASYRGRTSTTNVTVTDAALTGLSIAPVGPLSMPTGFQQPLVLSGAFSDGSVQDVTGVAGWSSTAPAVVGVDQGLLTAVAPGAATVTAAVAGKTAAVDVTVTAAAATQLSLSCPTQPIAKGTTGACAAVLLFTDGSKLDVTTSAGWSSSDPAVAAVAAGAVTGKSVGAATIHVAAAGLEASAPVTVSEAILVAVSVEPELQTVPAGVDVAYTATGVFSDQSKQDLTAQATWTTGDPDVASISPAGLLTAVAAGSTSVTASVGTVSGATSLTVIAATLQSLDVFASEVTLAKGTTVTLQAQGTFSDGSTQDVTAQVAWSSGPAVTVAVVNGVAVATGAAVGSADVTASLGGASDFVTLTVTSASLVSIAVTPSPISIPVGIQQPLVATGTFTDGSTQDLTQQAAWSSSDAALAAVSNAAGSEGVVTGLAQGSATVTATALGLSGSVAVTVSPAVIRSLAISPAAVSVAAGYQLQLRATAGFSDGSTRDVTTQAAWSSSNTAVAVVATSGASAGLLSGVAPGTATVTASYGGKAATAPVTVGSARLVSYAVTPNPFSVAVRGKLQLRAVGTFSDGSTGDITRQCVWSSSAKSIAWVSKSGVVTGVKAGNVTVTAKKSGARQQASGTVR
ncbi:Ig-like domain-containing protein [Anaeromyxobacter paludicola]|uniref:BIG2 domain-containing protein n=1 Tax=Anaeromyxobacter paludicola TaxID=2918171 RepID=A0ABN6N7J5_9BACT|nr:Ig-like domain-containing protein [Anaeromyxobacter paludicola]BDG09132.1 hypothetical protein AMPC_22450 [Anaeromyxobacter paludicola]